MKFECNTQFSIRISCLTELAFLSVYFFPAFIVYLRFCIDNFLE